MKVILFSGTHPRHLFVNQEVLKHCDDILVIVMQREELIPVPPNGISKRDKELFVRHFANRAEAEQGAYGNLHHDDVFSNCKTIIVQPSELNSIEIAREVERFDADLAFIFGVDLILSPVIQKLPKDKINLHLGLSPWYKGGATLYWPFFFLQPQFAGITFHRITEKPDAGEIVHQSVPALEYGDKIHDVGAKCVLKAANEIDSLFSYWKKEHKFKRQLQKTSGRVWRGVDFHPSQLRVIYELFNDDIVDKYLNGELEQRAPKLFSCLNN